MSTFPLSDSLVHGEESCSDTSPQKSHRLDHSSSPTCPQILQSKLCIVTVGLPARGKTYIAMKLARYLRWTGINTKVFNVGNYRRSMYGAYQPHYFYHPDNKEGVDQRTKCAMKALDDVMNYLNEEEGQVAVFDATNTTRERRRLVARKCKENLIDVFYIEMVCNDEELIAENIKAVKLTSPDYEDISDEDAIKDFSQRLKNYEAAYEPLDEHYDKDRSWVKLADVNQVVISNRILNHLQSRMVYFLMNLHLKKRNIYICRHGESEFNVQGRIGGDPELSSQGKKFSMKLAEFIKQKDIPGMKVWISQLKRSVQTASYLDMACEQWKTLCEIEAGACDSLTYEEIHDKFPEEFALRDQNKYHYRFPRGESYADLVNRLEPIIMELERQENVLVICHQSVMRCLLAYFMDKTQEELPYLKCPLHKVFQLIPRAYVCDIEPYDLDVPAVDTYRPKPMVTAINRTKEEALESLVQQS